MKVYKKKLLNFSILHAIITSVPAALNLPRFILKVILLENHSQNHENYMKKHQLDYTLTEFEDGENFLKAAAQVNFQLVFMDIYMENMDGMEAARKTGFVRSFF